MSATGNHWSGDGLKRDCLKLVTSNLWLTLVFLGKISFVFVIVRFSALSLYAKDGAALPMVNDPSYTNLDVTVYFDKPSIERDSSAPFEKDPVCAQLEGSLFCFWGVCSDGLAMPMHSGRTNEHVIVYMVTTEGDTSVPSEKEAYHFQDEFLGGRVAPCHKLKVDYKLVIENHSTYPYVVSEEWKFSGYDNLEIDFLTSDNKVLTARKRMPKYLSDRPPYYAIRPDWRWTILVSLDIRLWNIPDGFNLNSITQFRPRFAFGGFLAGGKCYQTIEELRTRKRKKRKLKDREGELVGEWMPFQPQRRCWSSWERQSARQSECR